MTDNALKWASKSRDLIEGMLAPYGGPIAGKDLDGESFEPDTDFVLEWFGDWQRPILYHHGLDPEIKTSVVGRLKVTSTDGGQWAQGQLDKAHAYYEEIAHLVDEGALGWSSGSVSHLVQVDAKTGKIKRWPLIEGSLTPTPANPNAKAYAVKSAEAVEHLAAIDVEAPDAVKEPIAEPSAEPDATKADGFIPVHAYAVQDTSAWNLTVPADAGADKLMEAIEARKAAEHRDRSEVIKALTESLTKTLTPQVLHDAAIASGAKCASETPEPEPVPLLAIAGKSTETSEAVDLDALKAQMTDLAVKRARELLGS